MLDPNLKSQLLCVMDKVNKEHSEVCWVHPDLVRRIDQIFESETPNSMEEALEVFQRKVPSYIIAPNGLDSHEDTGGYVAHLQTMWARMKSEKEKEEQDITLFSNKDLYWEAFKRPLKWFLELKLVAKIFFGIIGLLSALFVTIVGGLILAGILRVIGC